MELEVRKHTVGENTYSILLPPPTKAMPLCNRAALLLAPTLTTLTSDVKNFAGSNDLQAAINGLGSALSQLDPAKVNALLMDAMEEAKLSANGSAICDRKTFDDHFSRYRKETYPALVWCLWECVKDFFPELDSFVQVAKTKATELLSQKAGPQTGG